METLRLRQLARGALGTVRSMAGGRPRPLSITYHITYRCNLRCTYCLLPHVGRELPTAEAISLIQEFARMGAIRLGFLGGEPLLRADLGELVRAGRDEGMIVSVVTNATLLPGRLKLVRDVDALMVSLDGSAEIHETNRGEGTFESTTRGIEAALAAGLPVTLVAVVTSMSLEHLDGALSVAERYGLSVMFQPVIDARVVRGLGGTHASPTLTHEDARAAFARLEAFKQEGRPVANTWAYLRGMQRDPSMPIRGRCPAVRSVLAVLPDGRLAPCCEQHFAGETSLDDIARPLLSRIADLTPPNCDQCTALSNAETKRLVRLDPSALVSAARLLG